MLRSPANTSMFTWEHRNFLASIFQNAITLLNSLQKHSRLKVCEENIVNFSLPSKYLALSNEFNIFNTNLVTCSAPCKTSTERLLTSRRSTMLEVRESCWAHARISLRWTLHIGYTPTWAMGYTAVLSRAPRIPAAICCEWGDCGLAELRSCPMRPA